MLSRRSVLISMGASMATSLGAASMLSHRRAKAVASAQALSAIALPDDLGPWRKTPDRPVSLQPEDEKRALATYLWTESATYVGSEGGETVMVALAHSKTSGEEADQLHRPEICYPAQGRRVSASTRTKLKVLDSDMDVLTFDASSGSNTEVVSYWMTMGGQVVLPGWDRRLLAFKLAAQGMDTSGLLYRVSSFLSRGEGRSAQLALQARFTTELMRHLTPQQRDALMGKEQRG